MAGNGFRNYRDYIPYCLASDETKDCRDTDVTRRMRPSTGGNNLNHQALIAQLGERQTEVIRSHPNIRGNLKVTRSIRVWRMTFCCSSSL